MPYFALTLARPKQVLKRVDGCRFAWQRNVRVVPSAWNLITVPSALRSTVSDPTLYGRRGCLGSDALPRPCEVPSVPGVARRPVT